jgi:hypothetical protein
MIKKLIIFLLLSIFLIASTSLSAQNLRIAYKCAEKSPGVQQIKFNFKVFNTTGVPAQLSEIKVRYYYSRESFSREEFHVEYAAIGSSNVVGQFFPGYLEMTFKEDAGVIPNDGDSGEIQVRINMVDWMVYDQSNDFSFDPSKTEYTDSGKMVIVWKGSAIWGTQGVPEQPFPNVNPSPSP